MQLSIFFLSTLAALAAAAPVADIEQRAACDVSKLSPPAAPTNLPSPPSGASLKMVLIGTGTQNYSCADGSASSIPAAVGALATLHDANCLAAVSTGVLDAVTQMAYGHSQMNNLVVAGHHYFSAPNVPTFNIPSIGLSNTKKVAASNATSSSNVPWLFLTGTSGPLQAVYRVKTDGGVAPANCAGKQAGIFTVPYTAQYWVYA